MNISVCITTFNEPEETLNDLFTALSNQSLKPGEVIVVDASNKTKINKGYEKKYKNLNLHIIYKKNVSRAKARNIAISSATNEIIALTDVGCIPQRNWLQDIISPFKQNKDIVVAGFYKMTHKNSMQKAMRVFLGVLPKRFSNSFLPSARSMAFSKSVWQKIGGFDEKIKDTAEDTMFNYKLIKHGVKTIRVKTATVEWGMPNTLFEFFKKIFNYAKGDAQTKIIIFPTKGITSHNIKAIFVVFRYIFALILFIYSFKYIWLSPILIGLILIYILHAFKKAKFWGIVLQFISDFGVMLGFLVGYLGGKSE